MLLGHLAPIGPIAGAAGKRWRPEWPRWARVLPWAASAVGCVFPDFDVIFNILWHRVFLHQFYWPHSLLTYLPVLALGWWLFRREGTRLAGYTVLTFLSAVMVHLFLDAISHGVLLFYPVWNGVVGWTYSATGEHVVIAYLRSPNVVLELGVIAGAVIWWKKRLEVVVERLRFAWMRPLSLGYLSALPRHEGSRPLWVDSPRDTRR